MQTRRLPEQESEYPLTPSSELTVLDSGEELQPSTPHSDSATTLERRRLTIQGTVQGVGFRPFVYRLASELNTGGWVVNSAQGVVIEVEAATPTLDAFEQRLRGELPPHASICAFERQHVSPLGERGFSIRHSDSHGAKTALILPDLAICPDCLRDIADPADRRYRYPFTNCTNCGPRFTIIDALPYDRSNTTMRGFAMCPACQREYEDPLDRRFHAQPNACPVCGPQLALWGGGGRVLAERDDALRAAEDALRAGRIVAVKGLGGVHLMVDARDGEAVARLRQRKGRYEKPLAVMVPTLAWAEATCDVSDAERDLLTAPEAPIVLLRYYGGEIASEVAPDNPYLGVMLPYTPLHHLLLNDLGFPVVATSGNRSGEPICTDEHEALGKLGHLADLFLVHNRPITRHADDSVVCMAAGKPLMLRRARGYAPQPVDMAANGRTLLAVGAQQKNTVALLHNGHVFVSQHLGDMDNVESLRAFRRAASDFQTLYEAKPEAIACDLHPDFATKRWAEDSGRPLVRVQHHCAHVLACLAEHGLDAPVLGFAWDGTGYGSDGTIWGGEALLVNETGFKRVAHLRPFLLPGGDAASREPRRSLLGLLYAAYGDVLPRERLDFTPAEINLLISALKRGINAPLTSSMGRLFDAVAALAGVRQTCSFEGQAAMALEYMSICANDDECHPIQLTPVNNSHGSLECIIEWKPILTAMLHETNPARLSAMFHNTLAEVIVRVAERAGVPDVALTGGCFQNRVLLEKAISRLRAAGFTPYWPQRLPPNDGGIALGQIAAALREGNYVSGSSRQAVECRR